MLRSEGIHMRYARRFLEKKGYSPEQRQQLLDDIRRDIPNSRLNKCKFLLGTVRLYVTNQLRNGADIMNLNKALKHINTSEHVNEYDSNLNDESLDTLHNRFKSFVQQDFESAKAESDARQYSVNDNYTIVPIDSYEQASKYSEYTTWCVTHGKDVFNSYTGNGAGRFYFCLHKGFENVPKQRGEGCPLDTYGLSMIAVSLNMDGSVNTITCRWNHENNGNDTVMSVEQLEQLLGRNFYQTFKPWSREELHSRGIILFDEVQDLLDSGKKPEEIFNLVGNFCDGYAWVKLSGKYNYINRESKLLSNQWYDWCDDFHEGFARVELNGKWNLINTECKFLSNQGYDDCGIFYEGFAKVKLNGKYNYINTEGKFISNQWYDFCFNFNNGYARVKLNGKYNYINTEGKLISNQWFDRCDNFNDGFGKVKLNGKYNYINTGGKTISDEWYDTIGSFCKGFARVRLNDKYNYINKDCKLISNEWFDYCDGFHEGLAVVVLNGRKNLINTEGKIICEMWFDV